MYSFSKPLILACTVPFVWAASLSASLVDYHFDSNATIYDPVVSVTKVSAGSFRGGPGAESMPTGTSGVAQSGRSLFMNNTGFYQTTLPGAVTASDCFFFDVTVDSGSQVDFSNISFYSLRRENVDGDPNADEGLGAPQAFALYSNADNYATSIGSGTIDLADNSSVFSFHNFDLSGNASLQGRTGTTIFQMVFYVPDGIATPSERAFRIDEVSVDGSVTPIPESRQAALPKSATEESNIPRSSEPMVVFHVSVDGDDTASGTEETPFATLDRARAAVRSINGEMDGDIVVEVGPGNYIPKEPFRLGVSDSGSGGYRVIYRAAEEPGSARLIGGRILEGWESVGDGIYRTELPEGIRFDTLYENGVRARKARFPNYDFNPRFPLSGASYLTTATGGTDGFIWEETDLDFLHGVESTEGLSAVIWPWGFADWQKMTRRAGEIDFQRKFVSLPDHDKGGAPALSGGSRYYLEGLLVFLDQPGEFYLDRDTGVLLYWPRFGNPNGREIIAPTLDSIIVIEGESAENPVRGLTVEGLELAYTDTYPFIAGPSHFPWAPANQHGGLGEGAFGTLHLRYTEDVTIRLNHIKGSGFSGIYLDRSNKEDVIYGNWIEDSGISGIVLAYHRERRSHPDDVNAGNRIENNMIHGLGSIGVDSAGVNLWGGHDNKIIHNEIFDGARYAVSLRGPYTQMRMTGEDRKAGDTNRPVTENNWIAYNHFYRVGQDSGDMGAIHMSGISSQTHHPVNRMEQLLITDVAADPSMKDLQPNGIFFDYTEGVTDQELVDIDIRRTASPFRTNRTDVRHLYENVSWLEGFDPERMKYESIGLHDDFPEVFGAPEEVSGVEVSETVESGETVLRVSWKDPQDDDMAGVWLTFEGHSGSDPKFVPAGRESVVLFRPASERPLEMRIMTVDQSGNRSHGLLIPAAEPPGRLDDLSVFGIAGGIELEWNGDADEEGSVRATLARPSRSVSTAVGTGRLQMAGLSDGNVFALQIDRIDEEGHVWPVEEVRVVAGEGAALPVDTVAWWTFEEEGLHAGKSLGDRSGKGHTLFVEGAGLELVEGRYGQAIRFTGDGSHLRVLDPTGLQPDSGDYAVSLWIRREASTRMAGRIVDFGGGLQGEWEHWGAEAGEPKPGGGFSIFSNDYSVGSLLRTSDGGSARLSEKGYSLVDGWHHIVWNLRRGNRIELWVDGELTATQKLNAKTSGDIVPESEFILGRKMEPEHRNLLWTGLLDQVRVYKRSLSPAEIGALFGEAGHGGG